MDKLPKRFRDKFIINKDTDCWEWKAEITHDGYGRYCYKYRRYMSHRFSYEIMIGPIPEGLQIDHLCRNRSCCNPEHLEAVTCKENLSRGLGCMPGVIVSANKRKAKIHCKYSHEFTPENTYTYKNKRSCKICNCRRVKESQLRKKNS